MCDVCVLNIRKARKSHICYECDGTIQRNERYFYYSGIWESKPTSFKICVDCDALYGHCLVQCLHDKEARDEIILDKDC